jgi:acetyl esterase/lipase
MRWNNETPSPRPPILDNGKDSKIPSREAGREIPIRVFSPDSEPVKGVFLHIHGGGWVLQSEHYQDGYLNLMAQKANLAVVSVGYRLAPENPFPKGPEDCYDAADYLLENAKKEYNAPLLFIGGEVSSMPFPLLLTLLLMCECHSQQARISRR